jgi:phage terminase Nu1 subunit (DNA packaging protein)
MSFISNIFSPPKPPPPPNPASIIQAQSAANIDVARLQGRMNRPVMVTTPHGTTAWEDVGDDRWRGTQELSPGGQTLLENQMALGAGLGELAQTRLGQIDPSAFSLTGLPAFQGSIDRTGLQEIPGLGDFDAARQSAEDAAFNRVWQRLGPQFQAEEESLRTRLANQGIPLGTLAHTGALDRFNQRMNDARLAAAYGAVPAGRAERDAMVREALMARELGTTERITDMEMANRARQQAIADMQLTRGMPMNELSALIQGSPSIELPQQLGLAGVDVGKTDVIGAHTLAGNIAASNFAQQAAMRNAEMAAMGDIAGMAAYGIASSDRRLKKNVKRIGRLESGLNVYAFNYIWGGPRKIGVMAQEALKIIPKAVIVTNTINRWLMVDYSQIWWSELGNRKSEAV